MAVLGASYDVEDEFDDGVDADRRRRIALIAVWLLVGVDAVFVAFEVGTWFVLRSLDAGRMWRGAGCSVAHPCATVQGDALTTLVMQAGPVRLAAVAVCIVATAFLVRMTETAAGRGAGRRTTVRWAGLALVGALFALGSQAAALTGLPFTRFDGTYATAYWFFMVSNAAHLAIAVIVLFGTWNRARLGHFEVDDGSTLRCVRILMTWIACGVCILAIVSSVFA